MNELDKELLRVAESAIIVHAVKELIDKLTAGRTEANKIETDGAISLCKNILRRYYKISKTPVRRGIDRKFIPIPNDKN